MLRCWLPRPQVAVYRRLLLYLVRLLRRGQPILLRLDALSFEQPGGWADRIKAALVALWLANEPLQASMPDPLGYWDHWLMTIARSPASWRTTFAKASFHVVNQSAALLEEIPEPAQYVCEIPACGKVCFTRSAWLSHNARKHGYQNVFRSRLDSTICRGCSCQFWSARRIFKHIAYSNTVCRQVCSELPDLPAEQVTWFWNTFQGGKSKDLVMPPTHVYNP